MVVHTYYPSYFGGRGRRIVGSQLVRMCLGTELEPVSINLRQEENAYCHSLIPDFTESFTLTTTPTANQGGL